MWVEQGMLHVCSGHVMRFFGHTEYGARQAHGCFAGEIGADPRAAGGGVRVKRRVERNRVKMYAQEQTTADSGLLVAMTMY